MFGVDCVTVLSRLNPSNEDNLKGIKIGRRFFFGLLTHIIQGTSLEHGI